MFLFPQDKEQSKEPSPSTSQPLHSEIFPRCSDKGGSTRHIPACAACAPRAAAAASRAGPCPASRDTEYRCICQSCSQKLGIQRCQRHKGHQHSTADRKIIFLAFFATLGCYTACMKVCQGHSREEEKMKRTAFKEALFLYVIKVNLYFKCCF